MKYKDFIDSGILELYVLNETSAEETSEVEKMIAGYPEIQTEINEIHKALENYAKANAIKPNDTIKPFLMAVIDYSDRMAMGETPSFPPVLNEKSKVNEYAEWLNRADMQIAENFTDIHAKIISYTPEIVIALVWIKDISLQEVHHNEFESFLIVEGTCTITIEKDVHKLFPGDFLSIPLYKTHSVEVTSAFPCKVILQRVAV